MTLAKSIIQNIIARLLKGQDYRIEIIALINAEFLQFAISFFEKVVQAKLKNRDVVDWYKEEFLRQDLGADEIAIHSGLNKKTIANMFNSATKAVVIEASNEHYEVLKETIARLIDSQSEIDLTLTIKFRGVSVELNINESLIVINTLAVKRAALRGGLWSAAGKRVEKPLMQTLCMLYDVPEENYEARPKKQEQASDAGKGFEREVDFFLRNKQDAFKCEVKLMGKGNPESADAVIARESKIFVADKLSDLNKAQLDSLGVSWVELRRPNGYEQFEAVLRRFDIPHKKFAGDLDAKLSEIFKQIF